MAPSMETHLPLITPRIRFRPMFQDPLPVITPPRDLETPFFASPVVTPAQRVHVWFDTDVKGPQVEVAAEQPPTGTSTEGGDQAQNINEQSRPDEGQLPPSPSQTPNTETSMEQETSTDTPDLRPSTDTDSKSKYAAPRGEPGKPNQGGFSLAKKLMEDCKWSVDIYREVKDDVKEQAAAKLDLRYCYNKQDSVKIDRVCHSLIRRHPWLKLYKKCWPVHALLKAHLKKESEAYRNAKHRIPEPEMSLAILKAAALGRVGAKVLPTAQMAIEMTRLPALLQALDAASPSAMDLQLVAHGLTGT
ncbi:hypothetical protein IW261DRAFT_1423544 [Armillaria novae-zelandiae]|uniref:Uncharacterized protein n=1 Tax=Armillaria novae-zelandiae TaxID=153914 RepID=A0AA39NXE4_9AGAR|nr:hypothetical protein IW261DRAFT_1423544 [Armillaria novae-zelandiae]